MYLANINCDRYMTLVFFLQYSSINSQQYCLVRSVFSLLIFLLIELRKMGFINFSSHSIFLTSSSSSSSDTEIDVAHTLFGILGNASALFLYLVPTITFIRIIRSKSTEEFSGIPYVMTLLNCLLATWYGLPFVSSNNILLSTVNGAGAVIESVYVMMFIIYAPRKEKTKILALFTLVLVLFAVIAIVSIVALDGHARTLFCGFASSIFSILMYASPLAIMSLVITTKSVEYMPFSLSLFCFLSGTSFCIFGLLGRDPFVAVPNGSGSILGALQLIVYAIYRNNKGEGDETTQLLV
ncbi:hypothetical protein NE237_016706 [Protea cynaroides]|uniref:Bidirectional sugar transporter SWEET n=1 Tax=Protea cynaroides TaxID=273540 RepID=A0A9Q0HII1_9MAGN|nr:hypothetical protein NE237_016706 [Protea cynaroides]